MRVAAAALLLRLGVVWAELQGAEGVRRAALGVGHLAVIVAADAAAVVGLGSGVLTDVDAGRGGAGGDAGGAEHGDGGYREVAEGESHFAFLGGGSAWLRVFLLVFFFCLEASAGHAPV